MNRRYGIWREYLYRSVAMTSTSADRHRPTVVQSHDCQSNCQVILIIHLTRRSALSRRDVQYCDPDIPLDFITITSKPLYCAIPSTSCGQSTVRCWQVAGHTRRCAVRSTLDASSSLRQTICNGLFGYLATAASSRDCALRLPLTLT